MDQVYHDRREAGRILGDYVRPALGPTNAIVVAIPRGGVVVGFEVARALDAPLDVVAVRRLGLPGRPEIVIGAIATDGYEALNPRIVDEFGLTPWEIAAAADREVAELYRQETLYREGRPALDLRAQVAVIVDDGIASGFAMRTAIAAVRELAPARIVVATPIATTAACDALSDEAVTIVCPLQVDGLEQAGQWYCDFHRPDDAQVQECLTVAAQEHELKFTSVAH